KVLLLGVGESGKSTVLKQFKVLHQGGYSQEELIKMKGPIYNNLLDIASDIITARNKFKIPITDDDLKGYPKTENEYISNIESLPPIFFAYLAILWNTPATQALLHSKHRKYFHLLGNAPYFISRLEKISEKDYVPTVEDVLKCRVKTKGIQETYVKMKDGDITLHICDVGGQRVERKKWIYCFSNVSILIFCVSLSDYDRPLREDSKVNALSESIELFDSIVNSKWFVNTQVMLFLNKIDVFLQKLPSSPIKNYFSNYKGKDTDAKASVKHILGLLKERNRSNLVLYPHITQATDSSNIELVFTAMAEVVMENRIKKSGAI
ncbi:guanine nucleotide binding protein, alpha subunit, partial [Hanseniaspora valbyensis NRRL Y-1626]